jgi:hypothetical protein
MDFQVLLVVFAFFLLAFLGFARVASNRKEWKEERKKNYEMAFVGAGSITVLILLVGLLNISSSSR